LLMVIYWPHSHTFHVIIIYFESCRALNLCPLLFILTVLVNIRTWRWNMWLGLYRDRELLHNPRWSTFSANSAKFKSIWEQYLVLLPPQNNIITRMCVTTGGVRTGD
jgi:hypothetical protein